MREPLSDVLVIGGGPAGLSAAMYAARSGLSVCLLEEQSVQGGQMTTTPDIENYPGVAKTDGFALAGNMAEQAAAFGAELRTASVTSLGLEPGRFAAVTPNETYYGRTMVLAMGARRRTLGIPGEAELSGRGVSYCAVCDGGFFRGKSVAVIGGGETALEDALYLAGLDCTVHLIHRRDAFRAGKRAQDCVRTQERIQIHTPYAPVCVEGQSAVTGIRLRHASTAAETQIPVSGVFICAGTQASTALLAGKLELDNTGRITAGEDCRTVIPGLFAAGDIRRKPLYQIVTAAADGAVAATACRHHLDGAQ